VCVCACVCVSVPACVYECEPQKHANFEPFGRLSGSRALYLRSSGWTD